MDTRTPSITPSDIPSQKPLLAELHMQKLTFEIPLGSSTRSTNHPQDKIAEIKKLFEEKKYHEAKQQALAAFTQDINDNVSRLYYIRSVKCLDLEEDSKLDHEEDFKSAVHECLSLIVDSNLGSHASQYIEASLLLTHFYLRLHLLEDAEENIATILASPYYRVLAPHEDAELSRLITKMEPAASPSTKTPRDLARLGERQYGDKKYVEAIITYTQIILQTPDNAEAYLKRAEANEKLNKINVAIINYTQGLMLMARQKKRWNRDALHYFTKKRNLFIRLNHINASTIDHEYIRTIINNLNAMTRGELSRNALEESDADYSNLLLANARQCLASNPQSPLAMQALVAATKYYVKNVEAFILLGIYQEKAAQESPSDTASILKRQAIKCFKTALETDPHHRVARAKLQELGEGIEEKAPPLVVTVAAPTLAPPTGSQTAKNLEKRRAAKLKRQQASFATDPSTKKAETKEAETGEEKGTTIIAEEKKTELTVPAKKTDAASETDESLREKLNKDRLQALAAFTEHPDDDASRLCYISCVQYLNRKEEFERAHFEATYLVRKHPKQPEAWFLLEYFNRQKGDIDSATANLMHIIQLENEQTFTAEQYDQALILMRDSEPSTAPPTQTAKDLYRLGSEHYMLKKYEQAILVYTQLIALSPREMDKGDLYMRRGSAHVARGDLYAALRDYTYGLFLHTLIPQPQKFTLALCNLLIKRRNLLLKLNNIALSQQDHRQMQTGIQSNLSGFSPGFLETIDIGFADLLVAQSKQLRAKNPGDSDAERLDALAKAYAANSIATTITECLDQTQNIVHTTSSFIAANKANNPGVRFKNPVAINKAMGFLDGLKKSITAITTQDLQLTGPHTNKSQPHQKPDTKSSPKKATVKSIPTEVKQEDEAQRRIEETKQATEIRRTKEVAEAQRRAEKTKQENETRRAEEAAQAQRIAAIAEAEKQTKAAKDLAKETARAKAAEKLAAAKKIAEKAAQEAQEQKAAAEKKDREERLARRLVNNQLYKLTRTLTTNTLTTALAEVRAEEKHLAVTATTRDILLKTILPLTFNQINEREIKEREKKTLEQKRITASTLAPTIRTKNFPPILATPSDKKIEAEKQLQASATHAAHMNIADEFTRTILENSNAEHIKTESFTLLLNQKINAIKNLKLPFFDFEEKLFARFALLNAPTFLVGGSVRDRIQTGKLNPNKDIDLVTTASAKEIMHAFRDRGIYESKVKPGLFQYTDFASSDKEKRNPIKIEIWQSNALRTSLLADVLTRDFTINTLYADLTGIYDPTEKGIKDLLQKKITPISSPKICFAPKPAITEQKDRPGDPLRVLRASYLETTTDCKIDDETLAYINAMPVLVHSEDEVGRFNAWLCKVLVECGEGPKHFLSLLEHRMFDKLFTPNVASALHIETERAWLCHELMKLEQDKEKPKYDKLHAIYMCFLVSAYMHLPKPIFDYHFDLLKQQNMLFARLKITKEEADGLYKETIKKWQKFQSDYKLSAPYQEEKQATLPAIAPTVASTDVEIKQYQSSFIPPSSSPIPSTPIASNQWYGSTESYCDPYDSQTSQSNTYGYYYPQANQSSTVRYYYPTMPMATPYTSYHPNLYPRAFASMAHPSVTSSTPSTGSHQAQPYQQRWPSKKERHTQHYNQYDRFFNRTGAHHSNTITQTSQPLGPRPKST